MSSISADWGWVPTGGRFFRRGWRSRVWGVPRCGRTHPPEQRREPLQVEGDVYAPAACNDEGSCRLVEMMEEFGIANLDRLGEQIIETSRHAAIEAVRKLKKGSY